MAKKQSTLSRGKPNTKASASPYLHGYSTVEQARLKAQARFTEHAIYKDLDFSGIDAMLEVGVGVGAQAEIMLRRFPEMKLVGIDHNESQLQVAKKYLERFDYTRGRFQLKRMDATQMDFASMCFDGAFICWVLEHVTSPERVLSEIRRVLKKGAKVYLTEVMNHSFFLEPYSPNVWKYWMAMNDFQHERTGDPFVGAKLGNLLLAQGFQDIQTKVHTWHFDNRQPEMRKLTIEFWTDILLSAKAALLEAKYIDQETLEKAQAELKAVSVHPDAVFYFSFMQAQATR